MMIVTTDRAMVNFSLVAMAFGLASAGNHSASHQEHQHCEHDSKSECTTHVNLECSMEIELRQGCIHSTVGKTTVRTTKWSYRFRCDWYQLTYIGSFDACRTSQHTAEPIMLNACQSLAVRCRATNRN